MCSQPLVFKVRAKEFFFRRIKWMFERTERERGKLVVRKRGRERPKPQTRPSASGKITKCIVWVTQAEILCGSYIITSKVKARIVFPNTTQLGLSDFRSRFWHNPMAMNHERIKIKGRGRPYKRYKTTTAIVFGVTAYNQIILWSRGTATYWNGSRFFSISK